MINYIRIGLILVSIVLIYVMVQIVQEPMRFEKIKDKRYEAVKERLVELRDLQLVYNEVNGIYASTFDELFRSMEEDSFMIIRTIGDPDDSTVVSFSDTSLISVRDSLFQGVDLHKLKEIPHSSGKEFRIQAKSIKKSPHAPPVPVFEISAEAWQFMHDLKEDYGDYIENFKQLRVGSLTEAVTSGNWQ